MWKQYRLRNYHFLLVIYMAAITVLGILVIGSAEESVQQRQMLGFVGGLIMMTVVSLLDYSFILRFYWLYYLLMVVLLGMVRFNGKTHLGAQRWIVIAGIELQPSEIAKILLILFFASFLMRHEEHLNTLRWLAASMILAAVPLVLIVTQPDLSTTIVTALIFVALLFVAGLSYKIIVTFLAVFVPTAIVGFSYIVSKYSHAETLEEVPYQIRRVMTWLYPNSPLYRQYALQQQNSIMAIGSGQLHGKGLNNVDATSVLNGNWIAEAQTDFIFAVVGEELGFVGSAVLIVLLFLIVIECVLIARKAKDLSGRLICCGMATLIGMQSFVNIGVTTGLIPNTGLTLPFVSYGMTSLISLYIGMGFVLNVGLQQKKSYKGEFL